jgi:acetyltransferase-like isoleucine patch superfamily enzyme
MHRGGFKIKKGMARFNLIHIGYHSADAVDIYSAHTIICVEQQGYIYINGEIHIGQGAIIFVKQEANLTLGDDFAISGTTSIICSYKIDIGSNVQFSWNSLVMDSDAHSIYNEKKEMINVPRPISIGNKVWIAANCTVLKGAVIKNNVVVACNSLVNSSCEFENCVLGGVPARFIKAISRWHL